MKKARKPLNNGSTGLKNYFPGTKELIEHAYAEARKIRLKKKFAKPVLRKKALSKMKLRAFGDTLQKTLAKTSKQFPAIEEMNPFYRDLLGLLADVDELKVNLAKLNASSKILKKIKAQYGSRIYSAQSEGDCEKILKEFEGRACSVIKKLEGPLKKLKGLSKNLKEVPSIDFNAFTVVLSGFPNVGKTTVLRRLTGSKAKISPYQFTTKQINTGNFELKYMKVQVLDTPGLLDRKELNAIEKKAMVALKHLASAVVFIIDPTMACGFTLEEQIMLLGHVKKSFPGVELITVINKADYASKEELQKAREKLAHAIIDGEKENSDVLREELAKILAKQTKSST